MVAFGTVIARAQTLPQQFTAAETARVDGAEAVTGHFPGLLIVPPLDRTVFDSKYRQPYHVVCYGYVGLQQPDRADARPDRFVRRFAVHVSDRESLPLARRVTRMLILLYGENRQRLRFDHPFTETVDVWLTGRTPADQGADAGGEQYKNQIYIYTITAERSPIEWTREIAHEYGHYALPGVTGFRDPEPWANGVLGERLFLKWIGDDLRSGTVTPADLPFVDQTQLEVYIARQVTPLIARIGESPTTFASAPLSGKNAAAMDQYTALALYLDTIYGSAMLLNALQYTEPGQGGSFVTAPDFLRGAILALRNATEFTVTAPILAADRPADTFLVYVPRGDWKVTKSDSVKGWKIQPDAPGSRLVDKDHFRVTIAGWRRVILFAPPAGLHSCALTWHRAGAEPNSH